jgi:hypothetical protein
MLICCGSRPTWSWKKAISPFCLKNEGHLCLYSRRQHHGLCPKYGPHYHRKRSRVHQISQLTGLSWQAETGNIQFWPEGDHIFGNQVTLFLFLRYEEVSISVMNLLFPTSQKSEDLISVYSHGIHTTSNPQIKMSSLRSRHSLSVRSGIGGQDFRVKQLEGSAPK